MKRTLLFVAIFIIGFCALAVIASPLSSFGTVNLYKDNDTYSAANSYVYSLNANARVDYEGSIDDARADLLSFCDRIIKTESIGELTVFYAHSPRVKDFGLDYNVMACHSGGTVTIATPIILGSY